MVEELLSQEEGKTLEFKENTSSLQKIVQTIVAFANTAGGMLVIGIKDKSKKVIGLQDVLKEEERLASAVADSIYPQLIPSFQLHTWRKKDILLITVPHSLRPYYIKSKGLDNGVYIRIGSTNRIADPQTISQIQNLREHKHFDEQPNFDCKTSDINLKTAKTLFNEVSKNFTNQKAKSLGLITKYQSKEIPSNGAVLLFSDNHLDCFPDARIRLGRFLGTDKSQIIDSLDLVAPISMAVEPIISFIRRNTSMAEKIHGIRRKNIPQYIPIVVREAIINAIVHSDYSIKGSSISIAIFDDRMEITNPGCLPFGLSMEAALSGISQLRNRVIGRVFRELNLIEQWGSGLERMRSTCFKHGIMSPKFEELGNFFRTTLYHGIRKIENYQDWYKPILEYLKKDKKISPKKAQALWKVTPRTTSSRLKKMCDQGILIEISTGQFDPQKKFRLA